MTENSTDRESIHREPRAVKNGSTDGLEWTPEGELSALKKALGKTGSDRYIARVCQYTVSAHERVRIWVVPQESKSCPIVTDGAGLFFYSVPKYQEGDSNYV
jgi:hypothetical protein